MYKRQEIIKGYFFYAVSLLLLAALVYSMIQKRLDYFLVLLFCFIPIEIFLSPHRLVITDEDISVLRIHGFGLIRSLTVIPFSKIAAVKAIAFAESDATDENGIAPDGRFFFFSEGTNDPAFTLYQINHRDYTGETKRFKVKLHPNEFNILNEKLQQAG